VVFDGNGKLTTPASTTPDTLTLSFGASGTTVPATPQKITLDLSSLTQLASSPSSLTGNTDGASAGTLTSFSVGQGGDITGIYSNGYKQPLGQMAMASFSNPDGLMKAGGNLFQSSANSGNAQIGLPDTAGRGTVATGFLEGSNVDLAQQFTNMIMAERGFQANSRVITTSDEILQDLVNIKH
jgi:flagellar hook protein FlgE